jgi:protein arginine kinase activator
MKCQRCSKQATLHITDIVAEDRVEEIHLCEDCSKKYLYEPQQKKTAGKIGSPPELDQLELAASGNKCEVCGISFLEFRNHGRFGCAHDYDAFKAELLPLLESVHSDVRHVGKVPRRAPRSKGAQVELTQLRRQLQQAVTSEAYEEAALLRDRIKQLEEG